MERVVVEYSRDKALKAEILAKALERDGVPVVMAEKPGNGVLFFRLGNLLFREGEYPYLVARVSRKRRW